MLIEIRRVLADKIGLKNLVPFGLNDDEWYRSVKSRSFSLSNLSADKIERLVTLITPHKRARGVPEILSNIEVWQQAMIEPDGIVARSCNQFAVLLKAYLAKIPGHRVYKHEPGVHDGVWLAYYVDSIAYHPAVVHGSGRDTWTSPPYVSMRLMYQKYNGVRVESVSFDKYEGRDNPHHALIAKQIYVERDKFRNQYLRRGEHNVRTFCPRRHDPVRLRSGRIPVVPPSSTDPGRSPA